MQARAFRFGAGRLIRLRWCEPGGAAMMARMSYRRISRSIRPCWRHVPASTGRHEPRTAIALTAAAIAEAHEVRKHNQKLPI